MKNSKSLKILIIFIIFVLILIIGLGVFAFFKTDMFLSTDKAFLKYMASAGSDISEIVISPYENVLNKMIDTPYESTITSNIDQDEESESEEESKYSTTITQKCNPNEDIMQASFLIESDDEEFFKVDVVKNNELLALSIPDIYEKYVGIENSNLKEFATNLGVEEEDLVYVPESIEEFSFNNDEINAIENIFSNNLLNEISSISKESFSKEKFESKEYFDNTISGTKYSLTLSSDKLSEMSYNILNNSLEDENLKSIMMKHGITEDAYNKIKENLTTNYNEYKNEIEETIEDEENIDNTYSYDDEYEYDDETINNEIDSDNLEENEEENKDITFTMNIYFSNSNVYILEFQSNDGESCVIQINKNDSKSEINCVINDDEKISTYDFINTKIDESTNNIEITSDSKDDEEDYYKTSNSTTKETITTKDNEVTIDHESESSSKTEYNSEYNSGSSESSNSVNYKQVITFVDEVTIDDVDNSNCTIINDFTEEDYLSLLDDVKVQINKTVEEKPNSLVGGLAYIISYFLPSDSNYSESENILLKNSLTEEEKEDYESYVSASIKQALNNCLDEYKEDLEEDSLVNAGDYLTIEKIAEECNKNITNIELISGTEIKCTYEGYNFNTTISIDGNTLEVVGAETQIEENASTITYEEKLEFNALFANYAGTQTGTQVKNLIGDLLTNADTYKDQPIKIISLNSNYLSEDGTNSLQAIAPTESYDTQSYVTALGDIVYAIENKHIYWVEIVYNKEIGIVDTINIYYEKSDMEDEEKNKDVNGMEMPGNMLERN